MNIIGNAILLLAGITLCSADLQQDKPVTGKLLVTSRQAYYQTPDGPRRPVTISFKAKPVYEQGTIELTIDGKILTQVINPSGKGTYETEILLPAGEIKEQKDVRIILNAPKLNIDTVFKVLPARFWTLYFLPHSHNDIGYTHIQEEVMKLQWENFEKAIELCRKTDSYPDGAKFRWNSEVLWAVESLLKNAPEATRKSFIEAVQKGWIGLDGMYANILTGLCREEELMHVFDASNKIQKEIGCKIETAMITDVPGYSWGIVTAMAQNGIRYFSVGPNYVPTMPNQGDRVGLVHETWGDIPFYWLSPSGSEKILYWSTGKGYSWFHRWIKDRLSVCGEAPVFEYLQELQTKNYPYDISYLRYTKDIQEGRGLAMYYYNLACNIPIYLHIDLRKDNEHCVMLWWFASTASHLGIGGTHKDIKTVEVQKVAMKYYKDFERFFKRGDFYGINEEIHLHALPEENAFMINMFNLSDNPRTITGTFDLKKAGLDPALTFTSSKPWAKIAGGVLEVSLEMPPWSAEVTDVFASIK